VPTAYITHPSFHLHDMGPYHPECPERLTAIGDRLIAAGLDPYLRHYTAAPATREQILRVHGEAYVHSIETASPDDGLHFIDPDTALNPHTLTAALHTLADDANVKAVVLRIDSGGDSALASELIWNAVHELKAKKPVIVSMSDVAASGGYYISMGAKKVYAQPGTLTGSIGVVGGKLALVGLYDKLGINTETIARGANAGIFSTTHPFSIGSLVTGTTQRARYRFIAALAE
jgi:signal peptide peptidase SppA